MIEEWKVIKKTKVSVWEISNYGNMKRNGKPYYPEIEYTPNKRTVRQRCTLGRIHRLVWEAFNGPIPKGLEIDHIDTDGTNNRLDNLRLVTHTENMNNPLSKQHASDSKRGEKHPMWGKHQSEETINKARDSRLLFESNHKRVYYKDGTKRYYYV